MDEGDGGPPAKTPYDRSSARLDTGNEVKCTYIECRTPADEYMIQCKQCDKYTHFSCTRLPPVQLQRFMTRGYKRYICDNCYKAPVHEDYANNCFEREWRSREQELLLEIAELKKVNQNSHQNCDTTTQETQTGSSWKAWENLNENHKKNELELKEMTRLKEEADSKLKSKKVELKREKEECSKQQERIASLLKDNEQLEHRLKIQGHILSFMGLAKLLREVKPSTIKTTLLPCWRPLE